MAKKKRKPHKKPMQYPLSALDRFVYIVSCAVCGILSFCSIFVMICIGKMLAYKDTSVVAVNPDDVSILLSLPLVLFFLVFAVAIGVAYKSKKPLFGNKTFVPQEKWYEQETPVFSADFWRGMSEKAKLKTFGGIVAGILIFAISLSISFLAIYPRRVLCKNDEIKTYNSFNELTETRDIGKADHLIIRVVRSGNSRAGKASYYMEEVFVFRGKEYAFSCFSFDNMKTEEALEYMLRIKSDFKGKCRLEGEELIDKFCQKNGFTEAEKALVYALFNYKD